MSTEKLSKRKDIKVVLKQLESDGLIGISVDCVIFGFDENELKVLLIKSDLKQFEGKWSLLGDLVHRDEDLDQAAYRILKERTGMDDVYLEQVRSFGDVKRHPAARVVTIAYCSLINIQQHRLQKDDNELHWHKLSADMDMAFDHQLISECLSRVAAKKSTGTSAGFQSASSEILTPGITESVRSHSGDQTRPKKFQEEILFNGCAGRHTMNWNMMYLTGRVNFISSTTQNIKPKKEGNSCVSISDATSRSHCSVYIDVICLYGY